MDTEIQKKRRIKVTAEILSNNYSENDAKHFNFSTREKALVPSEETMAQISLHIHTCQALRCPLIESVHAGTQRVGNVV